MTLQKALADIKKGQLAPVYLVLGEERYLADVFRRELSREMIQTEDDELNFAAFDMEDTPLSFAIEEASTIPFFGDYRLVVVERPYFLTGEKRTGGPEHDLDALSKYLEDPSPSTVLVFFANYPKMDERKKIVKQLKKVATVIDVKHMEEREVRQYMQKYIQNEGYSISPEGFDLFLRLTDVELSKMMAEIAKLLLYATDTKKITKTMVEELVPKSLEHNIFDMVNYVMAGQTGAAISLYRDLLLQGEETIKINAILVSQFRLLLQTKILMDLGYQQNNISDLLKIHPYRVKLAMQQARSFSQEVVGTIFDELIENDYKMKTGKMEKELLFELFILKIGENKKT